MGSSRFLLAGGDATPVLGFIEEPPDVVPRFVFGSVVLSRVAAVAFTEDARRRRKLDSGAEKDHFFVRELSDGWTDSLKPLESAVY